jgi:hypothetical protein
VSREEFFLLIFGNADVTDITTFRMIWPMIACRKRFFRMPARHIAHFQFIIEGYDGIATVTTADPKAAVVMVLIPDGLEGHVDSVLDAMAREGVIPFREERGWQNRSGEP